MLTVATAFIAVLFVVVQILLWSTAPSLRQAIRAAAPDLEDRYFEPWFFRSAFGGVRLTEVFAHPADVLAQSQEFSSSLKLFRFLLGAWTLLLCALVILVASS